MHKSTFAQCSACPVIGQADGQSRWLTGTPGLGADSLHVGGQRKSRTPRQHGAAQQPRSAPEQRSWGADVVLLGADYLALRAAADRLASWSM
jgi:hypothetical protein